MLISQVFRELLKLFSTFSSYFRLLNTHISNYMKLNSYLSKLIISKAIPAPSNVTSDPFMTSIRIIESKLVPGQQQVITMSKVAIRKVEAAQKTVATRKVQANSGLNTIFSKITRNLIQISKTSEYSLLGWPQLPDLSNEEDDSMVNIRNKMCDDKLQNIRNNQKYAAKNQATIRDARNSLNTATLKMKSERKVQAQPQAILDVLLALTNVENSFTNYATKLSAATNEIKMLRGSLLTTSTSTTTTTTTTLKPTTTTTILTTTTAFVKPVCGKCFKVI
jgi:hypothetical protein